MEGEGGGGGGGDMGGSRRATQQESMNGGFSLCIRTTNASHEPESDE